jgi:hypothetical protein
MLHLKVICIVLIYNTIIIAISMYSIMRIIKIINRGECNNHDFSNLRSFKVSRLSGNIILNSVNNYITGLIPGF